MLDERIWTVFKNYWQQTLTYWSVFFSFGMCIAFLGPTISDLRCQTGSTLQQITWVFFTQQFFLLFGSSLGGLCKKTIGFSLSALFTCTLIISFVFAIIPLCDNVVLLSIAMAIAGNAMGMIDTIANLQLVKLFQKDSAIFLQALHFFIGLGALISPLVADPFLDEDSCAVGVNSTTNSSSSYSFSDLGDLQSNLTRPGSLSHNISEYSLHTEGVLKTRVSFAFWIMALINLPVPVAVLMLMYRERTVVCSTHGPHLFDRDSHSSISPGGHDGQGHGVGFECCNLNKLRNRPITFFIIHTLGGAILFITDGIIGTYAAFVYTYAVSPPLMMGHKTAGCLDSVFWACITVGRLVFIYLSYRYPAARLLIISLVGVVLVQVLLLIFYTSSVFLFIGTCVLGLFISSVFPSMLAFTEDILDYKGCATTVLVTSASTGEMLLQVIAGSVINTQGSYSFMLCGTISSCIGLSLFLLLLYVHNIHRKQHTGLSTNTEMTEKPKSEGASF
ncbi:major facilitator superfamily domain-containing protein 4A [Thalassophryne amazonica]|uniref:major facilitator superfamily domain-containing protein 4A n=1 Tax=Thalassophryne amazonica TaxID=390379 RepID=UPI0014711EC1|nr:major facilitator superfamily domain-containing protein 4A [Thalassophryne amazonica]